MASVYTWIYVWVIYNTHTKLKDTTPNVGVKLIRVCPFPHKELHAGIPEQVGPCTWNWHIIYSQVYNSCCSATEPKHKALTLCMHTNRLLFWIFSWQLRIGVWVRYTCFTKISYHFANLVCSECFVPIKWQWQVHAHNWYVGRIQFQHWIEY